LCRFLRSSAQVQRVYVRRRWSQPARWWQPKLSHTGNTTGNRGGKSTSADPATRAVKGPDESFNSVKRGMGIARFNPSPLIKAFARCYSEGAARTRLWIPSAGNQYSIRKQHIKHVLAKHGCIAIPINSPRDFAAFGNGRGEAYHMLTFISRSRRFEIGRPCISPPELPSHSAN
jgi:hypothetical protein